MHTCHDPNWCLHIRVSHLTTPALNACFVKPANVSYLYRGFKAHAYGDTGRHGTPALLRGGCRLGQRGGPRGCCPPTEGDGDAAAAVPRAAPGYAHHGPQVCPRQTSVQTSVP